MIQQLLVGVCYLYFLWKSYLVKRQITSWQLLLSVFYSPAVDKGIRTKEGAEQIGDAEDQIEQSAQKINCENKKKDKEKSCNNYYSADYEKSIEVALGMLKQRFGQYVPWVSSTASDFDVIFDWIFVGELLDTELSRNYYYAALAFTIVGTVTYILSVIEYYPIIWINQRVFNDYSTKNHIPVTTQLALNVLIEDLPQLIITILVAINIGNFDFNTALNFSTSAINVVVRVIFYFSKLEEEAALPTILYIIGIEPYFMDELFKKEDEARKTIGHVRLLMHYRLALNNLNKSYESQRLASAPSSSSPGIMASGGKSRRKYLKLSRSKRSSNEDENTITDEVKDVSDNCCSYYFFCSCLTTKDDSYGDFAVQKDRDSTNLSRKMIKSPFNNFNALINSREDYIVELYAISYMCIQHYIDKEQYFLQCGRFKNGVEQLYDVVHYSKEDNSENNMVNSIIQLNCCSEDLNLAKFIEKVQIYDLYEYNVIHIIDIYIPKYMKRTEMDIIYYYDEIMQILLERSVIELYYTRLRVIKPFCTLVKQKQVLKILVLYKCGVEGDAVLRELMEISTLTELDVCRNYLSGCIPSNINNLVSLRRLSLAYNQLTGRIPDNILLLDSLEELNLSNNNLDGPFPGYTTTADGHSSGTADSLSPVCGNVVLESRPFAMNFVDNSLPKLKVLNLQKNTESLKDVRIDGNYDSIRMAFPPPEQLHLAFDHRRAILHDNCIFLSRRYINDYVIKSNGCRWNCKTISTACSYPIPDYHTFTILCDGEQFGIGLSADRIDIGINNKSPCVGYYRDSADGSSGILICNGVEYQRSTNGPKISEEITNESKLTLGVNYRDKRIYVRHPDAEYWHMFIMPEELLFRPLFPIIQVWNGCSAFIDEEFDSYMPFPVEFTDWDPFSVTDENSAVDDTIVDISSPKCVQGDRVLKKAISEMMSAHKVNDKGGGSNHSNLSCSVDNADSNSPQSPAIQRSKFQVKKSNSSGNLTSEKSLVSTTSPSSIEESMGNQNMVIASNSVKSPTSTNSKNNSISIKRSNSENDLSVANLSNSSL